MILDAPPKGWRRPAPTFHVKRILLTRMCARLRLPVALASDASDTAMVEIMLGFLRRCGIWPIQYDHRPPVFERKFDTRKRDTIPPANDPEHMQALTREEHDVLTNGPGGEKRITTAGSDTNRRAKAKRRARRDHGYYGKGKWGGIPIPQRRHKWPKRKFPKRSMSPSTSRRPR